MAKKISINGFGRIGRQTLKALLNLSDLEIVAINDLMDIESLVYLLRYDSIYGKFNKEIKIENNSIIIDGKKITVLSEKDPNNLPWKKMKIDVVLECTGFFTERELAEKHLAAGAKKVIISTNAKGGIKPLVVGVNDHTYHSANDHIVANGSCTTNALAPVSKVLDDKFGIEKALMTTVHGYTSSQSLVDGPSKKDMRRGRAAAVNLILTSTGAAKATCDVFEQLKGKFDGKSIRVPVPTVSLIDMTAILSEEVKVSELNNAFIQSAQGDLKDIMGVTQEPLVSTDFIGDTRSSIVDLSSTMAVENLVKIFAWYDNEYGYAYNLAKTAEYIAKKL